jgi:molybdopterin biosynthesis enzyme
VRLVDANIRVAASDVLSARDVPPFARAGMDGFAVRAEDTFGASRYEPRTLRIIDKVYTGQVPPSRSMPAPRSRSPLVRPMPQGADAGRHGRRRPRPLVMRCA